MSQVLDALLTVPAPLAYALIAALTFGEAAVFVGFVLPGETAVLLGGALAATGHLFLPVLLAAVVVAAITGDSVGYEVGRYFGPRVLGSRLLRRHRRRLDGASTFLRERGGWAVLVGRFTAFLRAVVPALAGASRMPYRRFLAYNAAGGLLWGTGVGLLGYVAGSSYEQVARLLGRSSTVVIVVLVVVALILWRAARRRRERPDDVDGGADRVCSPGRRRPVS